MDYRILGHITAYNDLESLNNCIISLSNQTYRLEELLIIDNSPVALAITSSLSHIPLNIQHYPENIGVAGSLFKGIEYAIRNNFDFIWTFDQDSFAVPSTLEKLIDFYKHWPVKEEIGIIACLAVDRITGQKDGGFLYQNYRFQKISYNALKNYYECDAVITSGSLISCQVARNVPLPNSLLFIDAVDLDYCTKIRQYNYKIFVLSSVILAHRFGQSIKVHLPCTSEDRYLYTYSSLRYFYVHRNHTYLEIRLARTLFWQLVSLIYRILKAVRKIGVILIFESTEKPFKVYGCLKGTVDGVIGRLGKTWC